ASAGAGPAPAPGYVAPRRRARARHADRGVAAAPGRPDDHDARVPVRRREDHRRLRRRHPRQVHDLIQVTSLKIASLPLVTCYLLLVTCDLSVLSGIHPDEIAITPVAPPNQRRSVVRPPDEHSP